MGGVRRLFIVTCAPLLLLGLVAFLLHGIYAITTSAELGVDKPKAEFFTKILDMANLKPEETAYVGDRVDNDVRPSKAAGITAVFLERGPFGKVHARRGDAAEADIHVKSLADLPGAFAAFRAARR